MSLSWSRLLLTLVWSVPAFAGGPALGFRGDGSGHYPGVTPPTSWSEQTRTWSVVMPAWGNASPVLLGKLVCTTAEPTWVVCVDQQTGAAGWRADNAYAQTLKGAERAAFEQRIAALPARREAFKTVREAYSLAKRELRARADDAALVAELGRLTAEMTALRTELDALEQLDTPATREIIGYATATPVVHEGALFAVFGNGVVSRFEADGRRAWSVWLGPSPKEMRGYHLGTSASPVVVGGVLVVAHGHVVGLDPATGAVRWKGPEYKDFGTPGAGVAGGVPFVALPTGEVLHAGDGRVLAKGLHDQWYTGPTVDGDVVTFVGGHGNVQLEEAGFVPASSWRLVPSGGGFKAEPMWQVKLPGKAAFFNHPVRIGDAVVAIDNSGEVWVLDGRTGALRTRWKPSQPLGAAYSSPIEAGGLVFAEGEEGRGVVLEVGASVRLVAESRVGKLRSVPCFTGSAMFLRTLNALERYDRPGTR